MQKITLQNIKSPELKIVMLGMAIYFALLNLINELP